MSKVINKSSRATKVTVSTLLLTSSIPFAFPIGQASAFSDLSTSDTHYANIMELLNRGVISGYTDGTFQSGKYVTRAQVAKIIANILNLDTSNITNPNFSDVQPSNEFYPYIAALANEGIISGSQGKFNPNGHITRGQMAKIIARAFDLSLDDTTHTFKDVPTTHEFAPYINVLAAFNITTGKANGKFEMYGLVTRGQLASFVVRAEKAVTVSNVVGEIENITENTIDINGITYEFSSAFSFLALEKNKSALNGATIDIQQQNGRVVAVNELTLIDASTFDGDQNTIGTLITSSNLTSLANINVDELIVQSNASNVKLSNVHAVKATFTNSDKVASIANTKPISTNYTIDDSVIEHLVVLANNTLIENNRSTISHAELKALVTTLINEFMKVTIPNNSTLYGENKINELAIDAKNNESPRITLDPQSTVKEVNLVVAGIITKLEDAIKNNIISLTDTVSTGNNNGIITPSTPTYPDIPYIPTPPVTPSNPDGNSGAETPGSSTGGNSGTDTPGGSMGGNSGSEIPGGSTGGNSGTDTPGGSMGGNSGSEIPGGSTGGNSGAETPGGSTEGNSGSEIPGGSTDGNSGTDTPGGSTGGNSGSEIPGGSTDGNSGAETPGGSMGGNSGTDTPGGSTGGNSGTDTPGGSTGGNSGSEIPGGSTGAQKPGALTSEQISINSTYDTITGTTTTADAGAVVTVKQNNLIIGSAMVKEDGSFTITLNSKVLASSPLNITISLNNFDETLNWVVPTINIADGGSEPDGNTGNSDTGGNTGNPDTGGNTGNPDTGGNTGGSDTDNGTILVAQEQIVTNEQGLVAIKIDENTTATISDGNLASFLTTSANTVSAMNLIIEDNNVVGVEEITLVASAMAELDAKGLRATTVQVQGAASLANIEATNLIVTSSNPTLAFNNVMAENTTIDGNIQQLSGLITNDLTVSTDSSITFDNVQIEGNVTINGAVSAVTGLEVNGQLTIAAANTVTLTNVATTTNGAVQVTNADEIIIAAPSTVARNHLKVAAISPIASTTSTYEIAFTGTTAGTLTINRTDAKVDVQSNNDFSTINIAADKTVLNGLSSKTGIHVYNNVTNLTLNGTVSTLKLTLTNPIKLLGTAQITELDITTALTPTSLVDINEISVPTTIKLNGSTITTANPIFVGVSSTPTLSALDFGKYIIDGATITKFKQLKAGDNADTVTQSNSIKYNGEFLLYHTTDRIVAFDSSGQKYVLNVAPRQQHSLISSIRDGVVTLQTTFNPADSVKDSLGYFKLYLSGFLNAELDNNLSNLTFTTDSEGYSTVAINTGKTIRTNYVIAIKEQAFIAGATDNHKLMVLKDLARIADETGDPYIIRPFLVELALTNNITFDSLLLQKYVDELVYNEGTYTSLNQIAELVTEVGEQTAYKLAVTPEDLYLQGTNLAFDYSNAAVMRAEILDGKVVFIPQAAGKTTVKVTDAYGNATLVAFEVTGTTGNFSINQSDPTKPNIVKYALSATQEVIEGASNFRVVETATGDLLLPTTLTAQSAIVRDTAAAIDSSLTKVTSSASDNIYSISTAVHALTKLTLADLGFITNPTALNDGITGSIIGEGAVWLYAINSGTSNHTFTTGGDKSTTIQVVSNGTTITSTHIAKSTAVATSTLGLSAIKAAETIKQPPTDLIHAYIVDGEVHFFASDAAKTSFVLTDTANKKTIVNVVATKDETGKVTVTATPVIASIQNEGQADNNTGFAILTPTSSTTLHFSGLTIYAQAEGKETITLSNGRQYEVEVTFSEATGYTMSATLLKNVVIKYTDVHLQGITGGTSTTATTEVVNNMLIVTMENEGTAEIIISNGTDSTQKAVVYITKDASGYSVPVIVRKELTAADLGLNTITGINGDATSSHRAVFKDGKVYVYGYGTTSGAYKVNGEIGGSPASTYINVTATQTNQYAIEAIPATHTATETLKASANGGSVVRINGNKLYAIGTGPIELEMENNSYYTFTVSIDSSGHYVFSTPIIVSRKSFTLEELGLTSISTVASNDPTIATATKVENTVVVSTGTGTEDGKTTINVTGSYGDQTVNTSIFVKRTGATVEAAVEKIDTPLNLSTAGFTSLGESTITWLNNNIVRAVTDGTTIDLFIIGNGNTAMKIVGNVTGLVNLTSDVTADGKRTITADIVDETFTEEATIIEGADKVRLSTDKKTVYATATGSAKVKVGTQVYQINIGISEDGKNYTISAEPITNAVTISASSYGLGTGDVTAVTGYDATLISLTKYGNSISLYPTSETANGKTSLLIETATGKSIVNVTVTAGVITVENEAVKQETTTAPTLLHTEDNAIVRIDGDIIYAIGEGTAELLIGNEVQKVVVEKVAGHFEMSTPTTISNVVLDATALGLGNTLSITASEHNGNMVFAKIINEKLVAHGLQDGATLITVKDSAGKQTIVQVKQDVDGFVGEVAKTIPDASVLGFTTISSVTISGTKARYHTDGNLYLLASGYSHGIFTETVPDPNDANLSITTKTLATIHTVADANGWLTASVTAVQKTNEQLGGTVDGLITTMPNNGTDENVVRISADGKTLIATGTGTTKVQLGNTVLAITVAADENGQVTMSYATTASITVTAASAGLSKITAFTDTSAVVTGTTNGNDFIFYAAPGKANVATQVRVTDGNNNYAIVNINIDSAGNLTKADVVSFELEAPTPTVTNTASNATTRAVWDGNKVTIYPTETTTGKSTLTFKDATINVDTSSAAGELKTTAAFKTVVIDGTDLSIASGNAIGLIVKDTPNDKTTLYAKTAETTATIVSDGTDTLYVVKVTDNGTAIDMSTSASLTFDTITAAPNTYTVAEVTGTKVSTLEQGTDTLVLYSETDGVSSITVTSAGVATVYNVTTTNKITTATIAKADIPASYTNVAIASGTAGRLVNNELFLLEEGKLAIKTDQGLINVEIVRDPVTKHLKVKDTITHLTHTLKETFTGDTNYVVSTVTLTPMAVASAKTFYSNHYRITAETKLNTTTHQYELVVKEQAMAKSAYANYGLTGTVTATSDNLSVINAEIVGTDVIVYAVGETAGNATITVKDANNSYSIYASFDGSTVTVDVAGKDLKFEDLGMGGVNVADVTIEIQKDTTATMPISVTTSATGLTVSALTTGEAAILVKENGQVKAIINTVVTTGADGKFVTTPTLVALTAAPTGTLISGDHTTVINGTNIIGTGSLVYATSATTAAAINVSQATNGLYYVSQPTYGLATVTEAALNTALNNVNVIVKNDTIAQAVIEGNTMYVYGFGTGKTNVHVQNSTTNKDLAIIQVDSNNTAKTTTATVASKAAPTIYGTTWTDASNVVVRNGTMYAINEGTATLQVKDGTNTTLLTTTVSMNNGLYDISTTPVKLSFTSNVTVVTGSSVVYANGNDLFAQKAGTAQVEVNGSLINVTVIEKADGTFAITEDEETLVQDYLTAEQLGLTSITSATLPSNIIATQLANVNGQAGNELVLVAKQQGKMSFTVTGTEGKSVVYVEVISTNGILSFAEITVSKSTAVSAEASFNTTNNTIVRADGNVLYALAEGSTIIEGTDASGQKSLYKVLIAKSGEKLVNPEPKRIQTDEFSSAPTDLTDTSVARVEGNRLVALQVGSTSTPVKTDFKVGSTTYRMSITSTGDVTVEAITTGEVDLTTLFSNISSVTPTLNFVGITPNQPAAGKLKLDPNSAGSGYIAVSNGSKTVQVKVTVTTDTSNGTQLTAEGQAVSTTILGTDLGFYVDENAVPTLSLGIAKYNNGNLVVYPGSTTGTEYFVIKGIDGKQAIYVLTINGLGDYTLTPFTSEIEISTAAIDIVPTAIVATVGSAKPTLQSNKITVQYFDESTSYIIVKDNNGNYRTIDVAATKSGSTYTAATAIVNAAYAVTGDISNRHGAIEMVKDGSTSVLYVTDATAEKASYLVDNKLYNVTITSRVIAEPELIWTTTPATTASTSATLVTGSDIAVFESGNWYAKSGSTTAQSAVYKTNDGKYVEVTVQRGTDNHYTISAVDLASKTYTGLTNINFLQPATGLRADGSTIYGNYTDTAPIIFKALDSTLKAVIYTGGTIDTLNVLAFDIPTVLGWTDYKSNNLSLSSTIARIDGNTLYVTDLGTETITFTGESGVTKEVTVSSTNLADLTAPALVTTGLDTLTYYSFGNTSLLTITFNEAISFEAFDTTIEGNTTIAVISPEYETIQIKPKGLTTITNTLEILVPEWGGNISKALLIDFEWNSATSSWSGTITDKASTKTFTIIEKL